MNQTSANRFTDAEISIARETDLPDLLSHLGYSVQRIGNYYTTKEMDSIRIKDRRTWRRYSEQTGGDAITFVQHFCGKSFPEAVSYLLAFNGQARDSPSVRPGASVQKGRMPFVLPAPNGGNRRVYACLRKRGIASQVINGFIQVGLLYEDAQYHNCVFIGRDSAGQPVFANKRGTYDRDGAGFKGGCLRQQQSSRLPAILRSRKTGGVCVQSAHRPDELLYSAQGDYP